MSAQEKIQKTINEHNVVLYMKGSPKFPQCGFSSLATKILDACDIEFHAIDVLQDRNKRRHQSVCQLANHSSALYSRRIYRWRGHHERDV